MPTPHVSDVTSIHDLLEHPHSVVRLRDALANAKRPQSAEDFLASMPRKFSRGASVAPAIGKQLGIHSRTLDETTITGSYGHVMLGLLCSLLVQGMTLTEVEETGEGADCRLVAEVPSSALSWAGELVAHITGGPSDYRVEASVTFMGQKFAWGRGKRMLKRLFRETEERVREYESSNL